jgi:DNA polymerase-2
MDPGLLIAVKRRAIGYLGFKNARFGKIDAHIATCAFARNTLSKAVEIAGSEGFELVHGIVDSMWLKKHGVSVEEYERVCRMIEEKVGLPISFEGRYKWIVFLNSSVNPNVPVLNRYYGLLEDGTLKVRGIDLRRHDTAPIVGKCQSDMLKIFSEANNSHEFEMLIPKAWEVLERYLSLLRNGKAPLQDLVIEKHLSKMPNEYRNQVPQAIAAKRLMEEGEKIHAGQNIRYIITNNRSSIPENRALAAELANQVGTYDSEAYVKLLLASATNLLPPGYDTNDSNSPTYNWSLLPRSEEEIPEHGQRTRQSH